MNLLDVPAISIFLPVVITILLVGNITTVGALLIVKLATKLLGKKLNHNSKEQIDEMTNVNDDEKSEIDLETKNEDK